MAEEKNVHECPICFGSGIWWDTGEPENCPRCDGTGIDKHPEDAKQKDIEKETSWDVAKERMNTFIKNCFRKKNK